MKILVLLAFAILVGFIVLNRQRVYVRDPIAKVYRNNVQQSGVEVYINYSNDVLLEQDDSGTPYHYLVQGWNKMPGNPAVLKCLRWMICMTDADHATIYPVGGSASGRYVPHVVMSNREVTFTDPDGGNMRVVLR